MLMLPLFIFAVDDSQIPEVTATKRKLFIAILNKTTMIVKI